MTSGEQVEADDGGAAAPTVGRWAHVLSVRSAVSVVGLLVLCLGGLSGWLGYQTYQVQQRSNQQVLFVQVGRQAALDLTTIDWQHADADVQRILDGATGAFRDDFNQRSQAFIDVVKQAQSTSVGTVTEVGIESKTATGARVLVGVNVKTSVAGTPEPRPRQWRMRIDVENVGDATKVSNVEFVP